VDTAEDQIAQDMSLAAKLCGTSLCLARKQAKLPCSSTKSCVSQRTNLSVRFPTRRSHCDRVSAWLPLRRAAEQCRMQMSPIRFAIDRDTLDVVDNQRLKQLTAPQIKSE